MTIELHMGFIGDDIIAICSDSEADYAFHATKLKDGRYSARTASTYGVVSQGVFEKGVAPRQMVYYSLAKHLEAVEDKNQKEQSQHVKKETNKALN